MKKILVTLPAEPQHKAFFESQVRGTEEVFSFAYIPADDVKPTDIADAQIILGSIDPSLLPHAAKLEWLQLSWAGADSFTKPGVLREDILLTNASGAYGVAVSEHMVAVTFALVRRLHQYARNQQKHIWVDRGEITSVEGSTVLVLGLGDIGGRYAQKLKALGAYVIGLRRTEAAKSDYLDEQYTIDRIEDMLPRADIVAMVLPGGTATAHIMDERRLRLMKKGAYLINDGRGNAIDSEALKRVLADGLLGGVALDVTESEPLPEDDALWDDERVIITPHISGQFLLRETFERVVRICGENLYRYARGMQLEKRVDRKTGY